MIEVNTVTSPQHEVPSSPTAIIMYRILKHNFPFYTKLRTHFLFPEAWEITELESTRTCLLLWWYKWWYGWHSTSIKLWSGGRAVTTIHRESKVIIVRVSTTQ